VAVMSNVEAEISNTAKEKWSNGLLEC
jgi:hypothetical protein